MAETFDLYNYKYYSGPSPYLNTSAVTFDFALFNNAEPLTIGDYCYEMGKDLIQLRSLKAASYAEMFAKVAAELSKLEMGLYLDRYSVKSLGNSDRIAVQALHKDTAYEVIDTVWDWLEAIALDRRFNISKEITRLQEMFRASVYGGPTTYSILKGACEKGVPTFYLPDEGLMQYGYGKYNVRGVATTFDRDSQLDSDFTTRKDDCKAFLANCGFPVPQGAIVYTLDEAFAAILKIGYPVAVKPVVGHKGIGATANVQDDAGLEFAFRTASDALSEDNRSIIVEESITGSDFRLICVGGKFVAAVERRPPSVIGDGTSTIEELIEQENTIEARQDTPTSALGKIIIDGVLDRFLAEQGLDIDRIIEKDRIVYLRKVANLSSGGVSIDATRTIHPDNMILAQDISQYFRLACFGVDVIAKDMTKSWKEGNFGIIEVNSAPGVFMHLNPAIGESIDVPGRIVDYFFPSSQPSRIPIITFNRLYREEIHKILNHILMRHPEWVIGSVCRDGLWLNHSPKTVHDRYSSSVVSLLRHPRLDLLIAEYTGDTLERDGMSYEGSNIVVLDNPDEAEMSLARDLLPGGTLIIKQDRDITVKVKGKMEKYTLSDSESFDYVFLKEINRLIYEL